MVLKKVAIFLMMAVTLLVVGGLYSTTTASTQLAEEVGPGLKTVISIN